MSNSETNNARKTTTTNIVRFMHRRAFDIAYAVFTLFLALYYAIYISAMAAPIWDGAVYLENAQNWLANNPIYEPFRPPLLSWIIAGIWAVSRVEDWTIIKYLQAAFTMAAGIMLYLTLRKHKGGPFAFGVASLTMLDTQVFYNSALILTEGISLFFLTLTLYFSKTENITRRSAGIGGGLSLALTFAARYPIVLQAIAIIAVETLIRRNLRFLENVVIGAFPALLVIVMVVFLKTGAIAVALEGDTNFTVLLSPFYLINSISIWGYAILLVPFVFLFKRTFEDKYNYTFIAWFMVSLLFWSANISNHQERFGIQFAPAVYFLALLAIENIIKSSLIFQHLSMKNRVNHDN